MPGLVPVSRLAAGTDVDGRDEPGHGGESGATSSEHALMMRGNRLLRYHGDHLHHAAVLVPEDVTVDDELPGIVHEPAAHHEMAVDPAVSGGAVLPRRWDREGVVPYIRRGEKSCGTRSPG